MVVCAGLFQKRQITGASGEALPGLTSKLGNNSTRQAGTCVARWLGFKVVWVTVNNQTTPNKVGDTLFKRDSHFS